MTEAETMLLEARGKRQEARGKRQEAGGKRHRENERRDQLGDGEPVAWQWVQEPREAEKSMHSG